MLYTIVGVLNSLWFHILGFYSLSRVSKTDNIQLKSAMLYHSLTCFLNGFVAFLVLINMHSIIINGRRLYYLRYVEWTLCTPLLTYEICLVSAINIHETFIIVTLTVAFCLCGTVAALTNLFWAKVFLGIKGSFCACVVMCKLVNVVIQGHDGLSSTDKLNKFNILANTFIWPLYVATWGMGPDVFHLISGQQELIMQSLFSIVLKTLQASYAFLTYDEMDIENTSNATFELMQYLFY
jgi:bacteriorhodopsin